MKTFSFPHTSCRFARPFVTLPFHIFYEKGKHQKAVGLGMDQTHFPFSVLCATFLHYHLKMG
jgi:hypothetical protein